MAAALRLRLLEALRGGAFWLLVLAALTILLVARFGGETVDGRYGLATDLAAALTYVAAILFGAFPIAIDRQRKRAYLPVASPVAPWVWGLGNALGAALLALLGGLLLFAAAAAGAALGGGVETHAVAPLQARAKAERDQPPPGDGRYVRLVHQQPRAIGVAERAHHLRLVTRSRLLVDDAAGTPAAPILLIDGEPHEAYPGQVLVVPVSPPRVVLTNASPQFALWLVKDEVWALEEERPFLVNAVAAGVAPALGAAALAALGAVAGAHLSGPVAALLAALVLTLGAMKGFLLDTYSYGGAARVAHDSAVAATEQHAISREHDPGRDDGDDDSGGGGPDTAEARLRETARSAMKVVLAGVPDLGELDRTGRVAVGEWTGLRGSPRALALLGVALALGATLGGLGVHLRRHA